MADFLILGADAAGLSAAIQIRRRLPQASIQVTSKGKYISYGACGIPYVISGDIADPLKLIHFTPESFEKSWGVPVKTGHEAVDIFPDEREVEIKNLSSGEIYRETYGKLLLATGAQARSLPFIDTGLEGVFKLHTIEDLEQVKAYLDKMKPRRAGIIGAGNIGLELSEALRRRGMEVLLFDVFPEAAMQWPPLVRKAVAAKIKEKEIRFFGSTSIQSLRPAQKGYVLETDGQSFEVDMVFVLVGMAPSTGFCRDKLNSKKNGAFVTDRRGRTSNSFIYAAGDCAAVYHLVLDRNVYFPSGSTANKMGRIAGLNMAGGDMQFPGIVGTQILKFFELSLARTGLNISMAEKEGHTVRSYSASRMNKAGYYPGATPAKVELLCEESTGTILGAAAVSESNAAQFIDAAAVAVQMGMDIQELGWFDAAYAPPFAPVWNALISAALKASRT